MLTLSKLRFETHWQESTVAARCRRDARKAIERGELPVLPVDHLPTKAEQSFLASLIGSAPDEQQQLSLFPEPHPLSRYAVEPAPAPVPEVRRVIEATDAERASAARRAFLDNIETTAPNRETTLPPDAEKLAGERFAGYKKRQLRVAMALRRIAEKRDEESLYKRAGRCLECGTYLEFSEIADGATGAIIDKSRLKHANFCKDRLCPMCMWRKSMMLYAQMRQVLALLKKQGEFKILFLTLTVKNATADALSGEIDHLLTSSKSFWRRVERQKKCVLAGKMRTLEVTYNAGADTYHPHLHYLLLVPADYSPEHQGYMSFEFLRDEWKRALGVDYEPFVNVKRVYSHGGGFENALLEVTKYCTKPADFLGLPDEKLDEVVETLSVALKNRRMVSFAGLLAEARKKLRLANPDDADADLITVVDEAGDRRPEPRLGLIEVISRFSWRGREGDYYRTMPKTVRPYEPDEEKSPPREVFGNGKKAI